MYSGPKPSFYKTPGLYGSIIISLSEISLQISYLYLAIFGDNDIHFFPLFIIFLLIGIEKGADYFLVIMMTLAPWSAKYMPQKTVGANP